MTSAPEYPTLSEYQRKWDLLQNTTRQLHCAPSEVSAAIASLATRLDALDAENAKLRAWLDAREKVQ